MILVLLIVGVVIIAIFALGSEIIDGNNAKKDLYARQADIQQTEQRLISEGCQLSKNTNDILLTSLGGNYYLFQNGKRIEDGKGAIFFVNGVLKTLLSNNDKEWSPYGIISGSVINDEAQLNARGNLMNSSQIDSQPVNANTANNYNEESSAPVMYSPEQFSTETNWQEQHSMSKGTYYTDGQGNFKDQYGNDVYNPQGTTDYDNIK